MSQQTQSKGGWIASFMIVGAVLVLGLLAALYYVKTRQIEDSSQPIAAEDEKAGDTKASPETDKKDDDASEKPATGSKDGKTDTDTKKKDETSAKKSPESQTTNTTESKDVDVTSSNKSDEELPTTGPADVAAQMTGLVALTVSSAAYIQSRRSL